MHGDVRLYAAQLLTALSLERAACPWPGMWWALGGEAGGNPRVRVRRGSGGLSFCGAGAEAQLPCFPQYVIARPKAANPTTPRAAATQDTGKRTRRYRSGANSRACTNGRQRGFSS